MSPSRTNRRLTLGQRTPFAGGPWPGVRTTTDPFDYNEQEFLTDAINGYIPDPQDRSGFYGRPGFSLGNNGMIVYAGGRGQCVYAHTALDDTVYNFIVANGTLLRRDAVGMYEDATPVGITIDAGVASRVTMLSVVGTLIVSDGVHSPWIATDLSSTPITGTAIDYTGTGAPWSAQHMTEWGGSVVFALNAVDGTPRPADLAWSEPGKPATGYEQTGFSNFWTQEQTQGSSNSAPKNYALCGTNTYLYVFRANSIGAISGAIGPNLSTTSTIDAVAFGVGTVAPQSVQLFGQNIFFTDALGRPWLLPIGGTLQPIWEQLRAIVDTSTITAQQANAIVGTSGFEPTLNLYLVAPWSPAAAGTVQPNEGYAFRGLDGNYVGRWRIGTSFPSQLTGVGLDAMGVQIDDSGHRILTVLGGLAPSPAATGYAWSFNGLEGIPQVLTTEDGRILTTEDGRILTTEGGVDVWQDNGHVPYVMAQTERLGYLEDVMLTADKATVITTSAAPVQLTLTTPGMSPTLQGTATPTDSQDGTFRSTFGILGQGRGLQLAVSPTTADEQWSLQRASVIAVPSLAGPEEP